MNVSSLRRHGPAIDRTKGADDDQKFELFNTGASELGGQTSTCVQISTTSVKYESLNACRTAVGADVPGNDSNDADR